MNFIFRRVLILIALTLFSLMNGSIAHAADYHQVANGSSKTITEHGVCRRITNNIGRTLFVPTRTSSEWSAFRNNLPGGVSASTCTSPCSSRVVYYCGTNYNHTTGNLSHGQTTSASRSGLCSCSETRRIYSATWECQNGTINKIAENCNGSSSCYPSRSCRSCFATGSNVLMANGTTKDIEDILIGEELMGHNGKPTRVVAYDRPMMEAADWDHQRLISINGSDHFITNNHPVLTTEGWKALLPKDAEPEAIDLLEGKVTLLEVGDEIVLHGGKTQKVETIDILEHEEDIRLYNFVLADDPIYYVNGMAVMSFVPDKAGKFEIHLEHKGESKEKGKL